MPPRPGRGTHALSLSGPGTRPRPARNLDWESFLASHPPRHRTAILVLVEGGTMREAGKRCGLKDSAALKLKRRIAADLVEFFGEDLIRRLLDGIKPGWECDLRAAREHTRKEREATVEASGPNLAARHLQPVPTVQASGCPSQKEEPQRPVENKPVPELGKESRSLAWHEWR